MLTQNLEQIKDAQAKLITQFKGSVSLAALLESFIQQIQLVENTAFDVLDSRTVDSASGAQLDLLGAIVGQAREGRDDPTYRLYLKVRIAINLGSGTPDELLDIFTVLGARPTLVETFPAAFVLYVSAVDPTLAATYAALLQLAKPAGVGSSLVYATVDDAHAFTFSSDDTEQASALQGWADDAQTTGGEFADVL